MPDQPLSNSETIKPANSRTSILVAIYLLIGTILVAGALLLLALYLNSTAYSEEQVFTINDGESARTVSDRLEEAGIVRSALFLYIVLSLEYDPRSIKASTYVFDTSLTTLEVAERITLGDFATELERLTLIEGERATQIAARAKALLEEFDEQAFIAEAVDYEGELFPDTYYIPRSFTHTDLLSLLTRTFSEKISLLEVDIDAHPLGRQGVLTLASIIEREANSTESMRTVSGILQNRLAINMALQADASVEYVLPKPLNELRPGELASILETLDSPYNTYRYTGLPPTPIGNPGLEAITAVLKPIPSSYFYYITGNDGVFYYAETYDQHLNNIERHLR